MRRIGVVAVLFLGSCAGPKGNRAEDYLPFSEPWMGTYRSGDKEPLPIQFRPASPRGKVWVVDLSRFYSGGHWGLYLTDEERGLLLHAISLGGTVAKLDPPQIVLPRNLGEATGWGFKTTSRSGREVDIKVEGHPDRERIQVSGRDRLTRRLDIEMKSPSLSLRWGFWLAPGEGVVRFEGGAGELQGVWDLVESRATSW